MLECEKYLDDLSAYADEFLSPDESPALMAHLDDCPDCQKRLEAFRAMGAAFSEMDDAPPDTLVPGVMYKLSLEKKSSARGRIAFRGFTAFAAVAAAALLLLLNPQKIQPPPSQESGSPETMMSARGATPAPAPSFAFDAGMASFGVELDGAAPNAVIDDSSKAQLSAAVYYTTLAVPADRLADLNQSYRNVAGDLCVPAEDLTALLEEWREDGIEIAWDGTVQNAAATEVLLVPMEEPAPASN